MPDPVLAIQERLTPRDLLLLDWLADHQVLTTPQITTALFGAAHLAHRRLLALYRLGLVDRFRPLRMGGGSYPWHYLLGHLGAQLVAAAREQPQPRPSNSTERARRLAASRTLEHLLGVNTFFTDLAGHARTHPGHALERWWPETECARPGAFAVGLISPIRPDGHGIYTDGRQRVAFFLEYDTGTEALGVLLAKLPQYLAHVTRGGEPWPLLIRLPSPGREEHVHHQLRDLALGTIVVATTTPSRLESAGPAGAVWFRHGALDGARTLLDLGSR